MAALTIGCCGFPVAQGRYFSEFRAVEVTSTFYQMPRLATLERWRSQAPKGFEFTLKAWQLLTHLAESPTYRKLTEDLSAAQKARCGHFQDTPETRWAWAKTREAARALKARIILFQTPTSFHAGADMLRNLYDFFRKTPREDFLFAWEPRGESWKPALVKRVCADLGLVHALDPLHGGPPASRLQYFRMHGAYRDRHIVAHHRYSEDELARLAQACRARPSYVFFNNATMFDDAQRFAATAGAAA